MHGLTAHDLEDVAVKQAAVTSARRVAAAAAADDARPSAAAVSDSSAPIVPDSPAGATGECFT
ncbi:hypothetical protein AB0K60_25075 [Thermopolyspora sp. NPDC052614]|uniref:hypothetical protein n=1 Tax=Thermopolyspora sp. NPDC052614 TaxID=3155682 RepID=UPI003439FC15